MVHLHLLIRKRGLQQFIIYLIIFLLIIEIRCPKPAAGMNTVDVPDNLNMTYLDTYTYSCLEGYITTDDICTVCKSDGTLSVEPPACTG